MYQVKKVCVQETPNLLTDMDRSRNPFFGAAAVKGLGALREGCWVGGWGVRFGLGLSFGRLGLGLGVLGLVERGGISKDTTSIFYSKSQCLPFSGFFVKDLVTK